MTDDTNKELKVEVPTEFDVKNESMKALVHGIRQGIEHLFNSYGSHLSKPAPTVTVKVPTVIVDPGQNTTETVYEDTKNESIDE